MNGSGRVSLIQTWVRLIPGLYPKASSTMLLLEWVLESQLFPCGPQYGSRRQQVSAPRQMFLSKMPNNVNSLFYHYLTSTIQTVSIEKSLSWRSIPLSCTTLPPGLDESDKCGIYGDPLPIIVRRASWLSTSTFLSNRAQTVTSLTLLHFDLFPTKKRLNSFTFFFVGAFSPLWCTLLLSHSNRWVTADKAPKLFFTWGERTGLIN